MAAAAFLFVFSLTALCSGAEATFSDNYVVQLPAGWPGDLQSDKSLTGQTPDDVGFGFKAYPSDITAEEYVGKALANTEKRPGFKLIEKGAVKNSAGQTAQFLRYQTDEKKGPQIFVKYYLQLLDKEVVVLLFTWPASHAKPPKTEVQATFNSVKARPAAAQEDSWLSKPAEKSSKDSKTTGGEDSDIAGRYVKGSDYMELKGDGTFTYQMRGDSGAGTYTRKGTTITFKFGADNDDAKLEKDGFVDTQGGHWVKKS